MARTQLSRGFTLIELLVVIAVMMILTSLFLPALWRARVVAKGMGCLGNLRQVGAAAMVYAGDARDVLPEGYTYAYSGESAKNDYPGMYYSAGPWFHAHITKATVAMENAGLLPQSSKAYKCPANDGNFTVKQKSNGTGSYFYAAHFAAKGTGLSGSSYNFKTVFTLHDVNCSGRLLLADLAIPVNDASYTKGQAFHVSPANIEFVNAVFADGHGRRFPISDCFAIGDSSQALQYVPKECKY